MDNVNFYGTKEYYERLDELEKTVFSRMNQAVPTKVSKLDKGYSVEHYYYADVENCRPGYAPEDGEICKLYYESNPVFEWKNIDGRSRMAQIICHSDGNTYFVFDESLYGYSVLNLNTLECMHYIPAESQPYDKSDFVETFIWCEIHYNSVNDYIVVQGCYWAYPYSLILVDFHNPMKPVLSKEWIDVSELFADTGTDEIETAGVDYVEWKGDTLICASESIMASQKRAVNEKVYIRILNK